MRDNPELVLVEWRNATEVLFSPSLYKLWLKLNLLDCKGTNMCCCCVFSPVHPPLIPPPVPLSSCKGLSSPTTHHTPALTRVGVLHKPTIFTNFAENEPNQEKKKSHYFEVSKLVQRGSHKCQIWHQWRVWQDPSAGSMDVIRGNREDREPFPLSWNHKIKGKRTWPFLLM